MARCGIALGSNLGDRMAALSGARDLVRDSIHAREGGAPFLQSPVYETAPVDCPPGSPAFLNAVIEIEWRGGPEELLDRLLEVETSMGRGARSGMPRNAPRPIDLDLLYVGDLVQGSERLELPHPRMRCRRFVLQPLAWIRPELVPPGERLPVSGLLAALQSTEPPLEFRTAHW